MRKTWGWCALGLFVATVFAANWTLERFGVLSVAGLAVPSGVLWVGLAFVLRDEAQEALGVGPVLGGIAVGTAASALVVPQFALASGVAFALSEVTDTTLYTLLRHRTRTGARALSNTVALIVDTIAFLAIAFGSLTFLPGQLVGKGVMTLLGIAFQGVRDRAVLPRHA